MAWCKQQFNVTIKTQRHWGTFRCLKGTVHLKMNILSPCTSFYGVSNPHDFPTSVEHKICIFEEYSGHSFTYNENECVCQAPKSSV